MEEFSRKKLNATMEGLMNADPCPGSENRVYLLNYKNPYYLDEILETGAKNAADLLWKVSKRITGGLPLLMAPGRFACSSFNAFTEDGAHILARNFDYKDAPCMVVWTAPENGYKSVGVCDMTFMTYGFKRTPQDYKKRYFTLLAPYVTMDGINEKGLAIAVLEVKASATHQTTSRKPITTTLAIRAVLDKCATVEEAIALLDEYDMRDSFFCNYHYQIIDAKGNTAIVEYVNNKMNVVYPEGEKKYQYLTNFQVSNPMGDQPGNFGYSRYYQIRDNIEPKEGKMTENEAMSLLEHVVLEYRHKTLKHRVTSLWSVVYNTKTKSLTLCAGADFSKRYTYKVGEPGTWQL